MDFAVYMGDKRTVIYKRGQGIVLNEPTILATREGKVVGIGRGAERYLGMEDIIIEYPMIHGCIEDVKIASVFFSDMWRRVSGQSMVIRAGCVFCIPSSLQPAQLNDYKTVAYSAGVADAEFIPAVIASAVGQGYDVFRPNVVVSVITENETADIAAIHGGEIVGGGTIDDMAKLETAIKQVAGGVDGDVSKVYRGDRITIAEGAGKLLDNDQLIKKIVNLN